MSAISTTFDRLPCRQNVQSDAWLRQTWPVAERVDPSDIVASGYDAVSYLYRSDDDLPDEYADWIAALVDRLPMGARILDLGCGCGVPVTRMLSEAGYSVTGVDVSDVQLQRARGNAPAAKFIQADMTSLELPSQSFDAIICLYAIIHVPLVRQPQFLADVARWLVPGGVLLMSAGWQAWTGVEHSWLGGDAPMWWSHTDVATYQKWLTDCGLAIESVQHVPDGPSGHSLFWALKRA